MTTQKNTPAASTIPSADFLIRGDAYLARSPDFQLIGRDEELKNVSINLMRKDNSNLIVHGASGVGISAIVMGLQASKNDLNTPFDVVGKTFYWLDTDALFSSGDPSKINEGFQKAIATLSRSPDTVLVIDDIKDFIDGAKNTGTTNIINAFMRELEHKKFQTIIEARDENLQEVFRMHSKVGETFSLVDIEEPSKDQLKKILEHSVKRLEEHHGVMISAEAKASVLDLTAKYPGLTLNTAQPKRSSMILEGAMTAFRYKAHSRPMELDGLEEDLAILTDLVTKGRTAGKMKPEFLDKTAEELSTMKLETENTIRDVTTAWKEREVAVRKVYADQRIAEEKLREVDEAISKAKEKDEFSRKSIEDFKDAEGNIEVQQKIRDKYFDRYGDKLVIPDDTQASTGFANRLKKAGGDSETVRVLKEERSKWEKLATENRDKFKDMTRGSEKLILGSEHVLAEFSKLSRIPMSKLQQDETAKLLNLENTLMERVFGQNEPVIEVAKAVRRGRTGLKKANKPIGSFLFLGPSGVGKTELAKALGAALFGDESALETYNMSEYMEKHAVSSLIGAPPGYDGYDAGGVLTNNMRRKPYVVNVFDEAEKAHKEVFDIFLQILDEGKLKDRRGVEASFANAINILTSNVGAQYFLDESLTYEEAKEKALKDLWDPNVGGFRPEFLNRFTGIFCFNRLGQPEIMLIAGKSLKELNNWIADKGVSVEMSKEDREAMCQAQYVPRAGGRGIMNYIERNITSDIADTLLRNPDTPGVVKVTYDKEKNDAVPTFIPASEAEKQKLVTPTNENAPVKVATTAAKAAFKPAGA